MFSVIAKAALFRLKQSPHRAVVSIRKKRYSTTGSPRNDMLFIH
jgi:hypothetical protein